MPAVMSPTQEYPVTPQVAPTYGRNPGDVSADLLVFNIYFIFFSKNMYFEYRYLIRLEKPNLIEDKLN